MHFEAALESRIICKNSNLFSKVELELGRNSLSTFKDCGTDNIRYGDILPFTTYGRFGLACFLLIWLIFLSIQGGVLGDLVKLNVDSEIPYSKNEHFIIISGFFSMNSLKKLLDELYHSDHKNKIKNQENLKIVIIQPKSAEVDIDALITNPKYDNQIIYFVGDISNYQILNLVNAKKCEVFLVSDNLSEDLLKNDNFLIFANRAFSNFSKPKIYIHLDFQKLLNTIFLITIMLFQLSNLKILLF